MRLISKTCRRCGLSALVSSVRTGSSALGADVTRIQTFKDRYPAAAEHTLGVNYRSTPLIVRSADRFAHEELGALRIPKTPKAHTDLSPSEMRVLWFDDRDDEADWVLTKIIELLGTEYVEHDGKKRGLTPSDFAILMRSTRQNEPNGNPPRHVAYTLRLLTANLPFTLEAGGGLFERPHVAMLRDLFELLREGQPDRPTLQAFFNDRVKSIFPSAQFGALSKVIAEWARLIHTPVQHGAPRRRIYPQQLLFDVLEACSIAATGLDDGVMQEIGVFSQIMQDVEAVFPSVDSTDRFKSILNFLSVVAEDGYDTSMTSLVSRPNAITMSTVHKMKGLEFPVVFIVDVENTRFPGKRRGYEGILPQETIRQSLDRGAYQSTREEQARLFYTALTRGERFLYVTGSANGPGWKRPLSRSTFAVHLRDDQIITDPATKTKGLKPRTPQRRVEASDLPTSFSDVRYYLRCPKDYQFRKIFGFSPAIPELFGFGKTVHTSIEKLHEQFPDSVPSLQDARATAQKSFHLKHIRPSRDPVNNPGPYERAKEKSAQMVSAYVDRFAKDFEQRRQVEARFEIPLQKAILAGAIDLLLKEDENGKILEASVIDFKTIEGGEDPKNNPDLEWTDLSLQVQLYAKAAREVLDQTVQAGGIHLLKDNQRVSAPVDDKAIAAAVANVEWAVAGIVSEQFPMRPHKDKCGGCDFRQLCPMTPEKLVGEPPPPIHVPGGTKPPAAFALFDDAFSRAKIANL
jgi:DNA helicase-2/ATP-dependent DNA helicase PcrA